ncbi:MAG: hypothetical protein JO209_09125 [Acidisphaera sp.]|nr:hypothetical protein [Acidisphaera sp.]
MSHMSKIDVPTAPGDGAHVTSPLVLSDRLLALAEQADRAGYQSTADRLVMLAHHVLDEPPRADA